MQPLDCFYSLLNNNVKKQSIMKNIYLAILSIFIVATTALSQTVNIVNPNLTVEQIVEQVLLGSGVQASNITVNGQAVTSPSNSVKQFEYTGSVFPISDGVVLRTDGAPSVLNDADLVSIGGNVKNGVIIEFDFIPDGNLLSFNYVFSSAEYTSFTCSNYNDVFGFFISGPGISGPYSNNAVNIATIPNSNNIPVGINTVNSGNNSDFNDNCQNANPNWVSDSQYWTNSYNSAISSIVSGTALNGSTVLLTAESGLECGETYHIKLAIANVSDQSYHSAVFLEANSFSSTGVDISIETNTDVSDTLLIAGCTEGYVHFTRPTFMATDSLDVIFNTSGTLTEGDDYPFLAGGDTVVTFLPGQDTITIAIAPYANDDGLDPHEIVISAYSVNDCGDTIYSIGSIWVLNEPYHTVTSTDTTVFCSSDSIPLFANTTGQFDLSPFEYSWYNLTHGGDTIYNQNPFITDIYENDTVLYLVTSTDACGFEYVDTAVVIMNQTLTIDSLVQHPTDCGLNNGVVQAFISGVTGDQAYHTWSTSNNDTIPGQETNASTWLDRSAGWYYYTVSDDVCEVSDSIMVEQNPPPTASFEADPETGAATLHVTFTNTSDPASEYHWDFGNGESNVAYDLGSQNSSYHDEGVYVVTLTAVEGGCTDVATKEIVVVSPPEYDQPNGFTPNGDGSNDYFTINAKNVQELEVVILNRWGNVVFESTDVDFKWNGKIHNTGADCSEGVYFYKFTLLDYSGNEHVEHGYIHLFRNQ